MKQLFLQHNKLNHKIISSKGFSIIEIIIVIVVIGILATITIVSYSQITNSSNQQRLQVALKSATSDLTKYRADNGSYPSSLSTAGVSNTDKITYTYTYGPTNDEYCLVATGYSVSYYVTSDDSSYQEGTSCPVAPV